MPDIVWIASYPKSGNTWVRFLIAHLLGGDLGSSRELQLRVPDGHKLTDWSRLPDGRATLVKTHSLPGDLPAQVRTEGLIYIVRNPFDVIASNFRFALLGSDAETLARPAAELDAMRSAYVDLFLSLNGDPAWLKVGFGNYRQHLRAWATAAGQVPSLILRYEDLHTDPRREVARITAFLGLAVSDQRIDEAVEASSFASLRRLEEGEIGRRQTGLFYGNSRDDGCAAGHRFVARGLADFGRNDLSPEQWQRVCERFAPEIELPLCGCSSCRGPRRSQTNGSGGCLRQA